MAHHGWVTVLNEHSLTPEGLKSPFGRLFGATSNNSAAWLYLC